MAATTQMLQIDKSNNLKLESYRNVYLGERQ